jgi:hypothetical protein
VTAPRLRPLLAALVALAFALTAGACGNREEHRVRAETEGIYLDVGGLQYQVQISRQLNSADVEDRAYFVGVKDPERQLGRDETWFAIFIKVWNSGDRTRQAAEHFEIEDTAGRKYEPVAVGANNLFAYRPARLPPDGTLPVQESTAYEAATGGALLLFKLTDESLSNRPLELTVQSPEREQEKAVVDLDV